MMTTPDIPPLEGVVIERPYTTVGDLIKKLQEFNPDLYVALNDSDYGIELVELDVFVENVGERYPISDRERSVTGLLPGDEFIVIS